MRLLLLEDDPILGEALSDFLRLEIGRAHV